MDRIEIQNLPEKTDTLNDEDLLILEDLSDTKKVTLARLKSTFSMNNLVNSTKTILLDKINTFIESHSKRYNDLLSRNSLLEETCNKLLNETNSNKSTINHLQTIISNQDEDIKILTKQKNELANLIRLLDVDRENLSIELESLRNKLSSNEASITELLDTIERLEGQITDLKNLSSSLNSEVNSLKEEANNRTNTNYSEMNNRLSENINDIIAYIRYYHPDVDDVINTIGG